LIEIQLVTSHHGAETFTIMTIIKLTFVFKLIVQNDPNKTIPFIGHKTQDWYDCSKFFIRSYQYIKVDRNSVKTS